MTDGRQTQTMETRLLALVQANQPENRARWAEEWKRRGGKVIGVLSTNVPEELISAAGMLPWGVTGTWREGTPKALVYRPEMSSRYCNHVLESLLAGELEFLDGIVTPQQDDDFKRLWDVMDFLGTPPFRHIMYLPHVDNHRTLPMWTISILELKGALEMLAGHEIGVEKLREEIALYDQMRRLLMGIYALRKREVPPLTGAEYLGITSAARIMPKEEFVQELTALLPHIQRRKARIKQHSPRLLVSSDLLDHPGYLDVVEDAGCVVAMDDLDNGSRYCWGLVGDSAADPWLALAKRYLSGPCGPRMANWDDQLAQLRGWVEEFAIDGVVELRQYFDLSRDLRLPYMKLKLRDANVPLMSEYREYHLAHAGALRTRVQAFVEMIG